MNAENYGVHRAWEASNWQAKIVFFNGIVRSKMYSISKTDNGIEIEQTSRKYPL
jgi:hypothetical protein